MAGRGLGVGAATARRRSETASVKTARETKTHVTEGIARGGGTHLSSGDGIRLVFDESVTYPENRELDEHFPRDCRRCFSAVKIWRFIDTVRRHRR